MAMVVAAILMNQFGCNSKHSFFYILEAYIINDTHPQQCDALQTKQTGAQELLWHPDPLVLVLHDFTRAVKSMEVILPTFPVFLSVFLNFS